MTMTPATPPDRMEDSRNTATGTDPHMATQTNTSRTTHASHTDSTPAFWADWRLGFVRMLPMWTGAIPVGLAFGVAASASDLDGWAAQLISLLVFSAAGQFAVVQQLGSDTPLPLILLTFAVVNVQILLLGVVVQRICAPRGVQRLSLGLLLTDASFAVAAGAAGSIERLRVPVLIGAGTSMWLGWNVGTILGLTLGAQIPNSSAVGLNLVVSLAFLGALIPLLRTRADLAAAVSAGLVMLVLRTLVPTTLNGLALIAAGLIGCAVGARVAATRETVQST